MLVSQAGPESLCLPTTGQADSRNVASPSTCHQASSCEPSVTGLSDLFAFVLGALHSHRQRARLGFRGCRATSQTKGGRVALDFMPLGFFVRTGRRGCRKRKRQKQNSREKAEEASSEWRRQMKCL